MLGLWRLLIDLVKHKPVSKDELWVTLYRPGLMAIGRSKGADIDIRLYGDIIELRVNGAIQVQPARDVTCLDAEGAIQWLTRFIDQNNAIRKAMSKTVEIVPSGDE